MRRALGVHQRSGDTPTIGLRRKFIGCDFNEVHAADVERLTVAGTGVDFLAVEDDFHLRIGDVGPFRAHFRTIDVECAAELHRLVSTVQREREPILHVAATHRIRVELARDFNVAIDRRLGVNDSLASGFQERSKRSHDGRREGSEESVIGHAVMTPSCVRPKSFGHAKSPSQRLGLNG